MKREKSGITSAGLGVLAMIALANIFDIGLRFTGNLLLGRGASLGELPQTALFTIISRILYAAAMLLPALLLMGRKGVGLKLARPKGRYAGLSVLFAASVIFLSLCLSTVISFALEKTGIPVTWSEVDYSGTVGGFLLQLLSVAAIPALCEELFFRGAVISALRRYGDGFAIVLSALLFGLMHGDLTAALTAFVLGMVFGCIAVWTQSLWPTVLMHFLNNAYAVAITYIEGAFGEHAASMAGTAVIILSFGAALTAVLVISADRAREPIVWSSGRLKKPFLAALIDPAIIAVMIYGILMMVLMLISEV